jgi:uncharacterized protein YndB with AHSA1/START domain
MQTTTTSDRIEKVVMLEAPRARVWRALTEVAQFNAWFGVRLEQPFAPGREVSGLITMKGNEHVITIWIETMDAERLLSFRWHPYAIDPDADYSAEPKTLVTFSLEDAPGGSKLTIVETGFEAIPASRRAQAFEMNDRGWTGQAERIRKYVAAADA